MKKITFLFSLLLVVVWGNSQKATESSLLWKITGNELVSPSYLFGTFHIMCKDQFSISANLKAAITNTDQFLGELDLDDATMQAQMMQLVAMPDRSIESYMSTADFALANTSFQKITGASITQFNHYKPFLCLSLLAIHTIPCANFVQPETELMQVAKENHKKILGLETVSEQMAALDAEPIDSQINSLRKMLLNFDSTKNMMQEMISVYQKNDSELLYEYINKQSTGGVFEEELLVKRNQNWIPKMQIIMRSNTSFFAVGAGHLGGQTGILALLRTKGYILTPVKY